MIGNHRTELDWAYSWMIYTRFGMLEHFKLVLKDSLRHVPIWGYVCQACGYLFVKRNWQEDQLLLAKHCKHLKQSGAPIQLLLFPEGADLEGSGKAKSDAYAKANNLPIYEHLLHPRTSGFTYLVSHLNDHLDCVVDMTVAYPKNIVYSFKEIFLGNFPEEIHFHLKRHPMSTMPDDAKELSAWLKSDWEHKETRLAQFYRSGSFELPTDAQSQAKQIHKAIDIGALNLVVHHRLFYVALFWVLFTLATSFAILTTWYVRWYVVLMSLANLLIEHHLGGLLHLELQLAETATA
ncbi:lysocardiolipin acyltransferase 1-like [Sycon ciliatum]|uniref:lysocardiolipin acyltransferase 1-like n=1 Tax=Sycon ciliatum TaxID=27933 RepID=UPI0031F5F238